MFEILNSFYIMLAPWSGWWHFIRIINDICNINRKRENCMGGQRIEPGSPASCLKPTLHMIVSNPSKVHTYAKEKKIDLVNLWIPWDKQIHVCHG